MSNKKRYIAVIERSAGVIIPVLKGGDGPDSDCLAVWPTKKEAREATAYMLLVQSFGVEIIDLDDAA
jgi:hypothetical protein